MNPVIRSIAIAAIMLAGCAVPAPSTTQVPSDPFAGAESAADLLVCDGPMSDIGGRSDGGFGGDAGAATADEAFRAWLASNPFAVPKSDYRKLGAATDRHVYVYEAAGRIKVVLVFEPNLDELRGGTRFAITELRACAPSEWGADVELGGGRTIWTNEETGRILVDIVGPEHCGWQSARILHLEHDDGTIDRQYARDPLGVFNGVPGFLDTYAEGVDLPDDATFSGYRAANGDELWFTPDDRAAYVVTSDGVERWPRPADGIGCA